MQISIRAATEADLPRIWDVRRATAEFYCRKGWRQTGVDIKGDAVFRLWI